MKIIKLFIVLVLFVAASNNAQPVLVSPIDGAINVSYLPNFVWDAEPGATSYRLQVATDNAFSNIIYNDNVGNVTNYNGLALNFGTLYYWHVKSNLGGYGSTYSFTTYYVPGTYTLVNPANLSYNNPLTVNFTWTASANADSYIFELSDDPNFLNTIYYANTVLGTTQTVSGLLNYTIYFWRVTPQNAFANGQQLTGIFTTVLDEPTLTAPGDGSVHNLTSPNLQWTAVTGATSYTVELAEDNALDIQNQRDAIQVPRKADHYCSQGQDRSDQPA